MNRPLLVLSLWIIAEIAAFILVGEQVGVLAVLIWTVATTLAGASLFRLQGPGVLRRMDAALRRDQPPGTAIVDGIGLALAAMLLILPGLLTDALGLLLAVPGLRRIVLGPLWRLGPWRVVARRDDRVIDGEFVDLGAKPTPPPERIGPTDRKR